MGIFKFSDPPYMGQNDFVGSNEHIPWVLCIKLHLKMPGDVNFSLSWSNCLYQSPPNKIGFSPSVAFPYSLFLIVVKFLEFSLNNPCQIYIQSVHVQLMQQTKKAKKIKRAGNFPRKMLQEYRKSMDYREALSSGVTYFENGVFPTSLSNLLFFDLT